MTSKQVLSHMFLSLALYNMMALGANQMMEVGGGYIWMLMGLGSAFGLGFQVRSIFVTAKQD